MLARFGMPPDVTRRQSWRDLRMIIDAAEAGTFDRRGGAHGPD
ncbi:hypothetical protein SAMN05660324_3934 [Klenkia brasiliensis]|uniref:Uncharacterized protein n=1 Tax=Klenkia brasiliensis TaxID=333142 RepID=A0A1G7YFG1_9ACTN|nr:hypothetical protein SAMN05660324_3934 [Klenkia brasiliensis]